MTSSRIRLGFSTHSVPGTEILNSKLTSHCLALLLLVTSPLLNQCVTLAKLSLGIGKEGRCERHLFVDGLSSGVDSQNLPLIAGEPWVSPLA